MATRIPKLPSAAFIAWLATAGIVPSNTTRVEITAGVGDVVRVKAWLMGDEGLIAGEPPEDLRSNVEIVD